MRYFGVLMSFISDFSKKPLQVISLFVTSLFSLAAVYIFIVNIGRDQYEINNKEIRAIEDLQHQMLEIRKLKQILLDPTIRDKVIYDPEHDSISLEDKPLKS